MGGKLLMRETQKLHYELVFFCFACFALRVPRFVFLRWHITKSRFHIFIFQIFPPSPAAALMAGNVQAVIPRLRFHITGLTTASRVQRGDQRRCRPAGQSANQAGVEEEGRRFCALA